MVKYSGKPMTPLFVKSFMFIVIVFKDSFTLSCKSAVAYNGHLR